VSDTNTIAQTLVCGTLAQLGEQRPDKGARLCRDANRDRVVATYDGWIDIDVD
jgi:hypothetical protein